MDKLITALADFAAGLGIHQLGEILSLLVDRSERTARC
jgi:hypothetical protein